jgi:hypothetical protein
VELYKQGKQICLPELSGNPTSSHLAANRRNCEINDEFGLTKYLCSFFERFFNMSKFYDMGPTASLHHRWKAYMLRIFVILINPSPSAGFESAKLGLSGKHANHYTTKDDKL